MRRAHSLSALRLGLRTLRRLTHRLLGLRLLHIGNGVLDLGLDVLCSAAKGQVVHDQFNLNHLVTDET